MRFANFVLGEPFSVKSSLRRPETEMDFALELEKFQGSIAEAAVLGSQKKWWEARSTVLVSLVTPARLHHSHASGTVVHSWDILNGQFSSEEEKQIDN